MLRRSAAVLLVACALPVALAQDKADDTVKELARLEGDWQVIGLEVGAKGTRCAPGDGGTFTFRKGRFRSTLPGFGEASGKVALGPQRDPRAIDLVAEGGTLFGVYRLERDGLTLALGGKASERQHGLDTGKQEPAGMVFTLRRPQKAGGLGTGGGQ